ncbi:MAG: DinB family protein [Candidatus Limnocylindria bacterium]
MTPKLTVDETMEILRITVPLLQELTRGATQKALTAVTDYGWSVNDQLAHLRACHDVLGGNMLRIVREDHPAWKGMAPRAWQKQTDYFDWKFPPAFDAFRAQRHELLEVLEPLPQDSWGRTATVWAPPGVVYEYSVLYYGDWMARHERSHLGHMARILRELG